MGFSIAWIAVQGKPASAVLDELGLTDSGEHDEANESPVSGAALPGGWYVVFLNDVVHPYAQKAVLSRLSKGATAVVGCQVEEHVMVSCAFAYRDGALAWEVTHESDLGERHLGEQGQLPALYHEVKTALLAEQDREDAAHHEVDYVWEIPVTLAHELVGYRHDEAELKSGGEPRFTVLVERAGG